ncbi:MAG: Arsenic resistance transcriptional regulator ArsR1 [Calditrichaeota bacterium]|nr:Arsenic resistance transcriptional regulator ArsR1 [Calditrichota bacterium]
MTETVELLRAMGEESRLRILLLLEQAGELSVADLSRTLELPQPKVSRHLSRLRLAGWVRDRRWRGFSLYRIVLPPGDIHREYLLNLTGRLREDELAGRDLQRLFALRKSAVRTKPEPDEPPHV